MKRILIVIGGTLGLLVGLGFLFPAVAKLRLSGSLVGLDISLLLLGIILTLAGVGTAFRGIRKLRA
jgi:hypothetical protein